jgi:hypothetical protein
MVAISTFKHCKELVNVCDFLRLFLAQTRYQRGKGCTFACRPLQSWDQQHMKKGLSMIMSDHSRRTR